MQPARQFGPRTTQGLILQRYIRLLEALASIFINTFGITQPTPESAAGRLVHPRASDWSALCSSWSAVGLVLYQNLEHVEIPHKIRLDHRYGSQYDSRLSAFSSDQNVTWGAQSNDDDFLAMLSC